MKKINLDISINLSKSDVESILEDWVKREYPEMTVSTIVFPLGEAGDQREHWKVFNGAKINLKR